ncbi:UNVERIFIED_CONTAM: hypothetical protein Slati_2644100 [Sesamum latifolium]|uniref:Uncharacterized protein n=1 Tax=Sesamum latifolium TaxID=2727402 RepID=A0AAW2VV78_9LAMI
MKISKYRPRKRFNSWSPQSPKHVTLSLANSCRPSSDYRRTSSHAMLRRSVATTSRAPPPSLQPPPSHRRRDSPTPSAPSRPSDCHHSTVRHSAPPHRSTETVTTTRRHKPTNCRALAQSSIAPAPPRDASGICSKAELYFLWCMVRSIKVNLGFWLATQFQSILNRNRALHLGSYITLLAINLGVFCPDNHNLHVACDSEPLDIACLLRMGLVERNDDSFEFINAGLSTTSYMQRSSHNEASKDKEDEKDDTGEKEEEDSDSKEEEDSDKSKEDEEETDDESDKEEESNKGTDAHMEDANNTNVEQQATLNEIA